MHKAGVVAVVGKPNVGKSTLVNAIVGHKVSIVSDKPQTTRKRVLGIATTPEWQIVFVDTPGLHKPHHKLGSTINEAARGSIFDTDVILVVVDSSRPPHDEDRNVSELLKTAGFLDPDINKRKAKIILCLNKMDKLKAEDVDSHYNAYLDLFPGAEPILTSFTKQQNIDLLTGLLIQNLPENPDYYPDDTYTDQPLRFIVAELVREKVLNLTREEVPHAVATVVEAWDESDDIVDISIVILVEGDGQKAIIIGKKGQTLKQIGTESRLEIEDLIGKKVFLQTFVKVRENWRQSPRILKELDYL